MSRIETPPPAPVDPAVTHAISRARELLSSWTVAQYLEWRARSAHPFPKAVTVDPGEPLGDILRVLAKHNILSAPVIERATGKFSGFVDVGEILGLFVSRACRWLEREHGTGSGHERPSLPQNRANETVGLHPGAPRDSLYSAADDASLLEQLQSTLGEGLFTRTLRAARGDFPESAPRGDGEGIFRGYAQASLQTVVSAAFMHPMAEPRLRPSAAAGALACNHRVGVYDWDPAFDDGSRVLDVSKFEVISQSDLVRFLWDRRGDANAAAFLSLAVADFVSLAARRKNKPASVSRVVAGTKAIDAFARMHRERVSALGVCDASGALVANVSASDLRGLTPERLGALASDVADFVAGDGNETAGFAAGAAGEKKPVTCLASETVRDVVERMVSRRVHHVYVCDEERRPVAMVTPNDVLGALADVLVEG
jgi:CBS domain-containing protein